MKTPPRRKVQHREDMPPHDRQVEEAIVASMLVDEVALQKACVHLVPGDIFDPALATVWQACRDIWQRGEAVNEVTVAHELARRGLLEQAGGLAYLGQIVANLPTPAVIDHYIDIAKRDSAYRALLRVAQGMAAAAYRADDPDPMRVVAKAMDDLRAIARRGRAVSLHIEDAYNTWRASAWAPGGKGSGITWPWMELDNLLHGVGPGRLYVVAGHTGMGKTTFLVNVAIHLLMQDCPILFASLEMSSEEIVSRLVACHSGVPLDGLTQPDADQVAALEATANWLVRRPLWLDMLSREIAQLEMSVRSHRLQHNIVAVLVDHLQEMRDPGHRTRYEEVSEIVSRLKALARDEEVAMLVAAQLSRAPEARADKRPLLSDLRESGRIEEVADVVMFITGDRSSHPHPVDLVVAKNRMGRTKTIGLRHDPTVAYMGV